jgi:hypothetical protein
VPTTKELELAAIRAALALHQGCSLDEVSFEPERVKVIHGYVSDGPGWTGNLAWVVHGERCFQTILKQAAGGDPWTVLYEINDDFPEVRS